MTCPKCKSTNVSAQAVGITKTKKKGVLYWLCCIWIIDMFVWIFFFLPRLIVKLFSSKKVHTKVRTQFVCQNCGHSWR